MNELKFPDKFLFGTAVASYQVEGGIYNNDWTIWENKSNSVCVDKNCNKNNILGILLSLYYHKPNEKGEKYDNMTILDIEKIL